MRLRLSSLEWWWRETDNPVYAIQAIALCLNVDPRLPIPEWCLPYLAVAMRGLADLSRSTVRGEITPAEACETAPKALRLWSQGKKNVFKRALEDAQLMKVAQDDQRRIHLALVDQKEDRDGRRLARLAGESRYTTVDRLQRRIRRGRRLLGIG
jgi:hypothetical protein